MDFRQSVAIGAAAIAVLNLIFFAAGLLSALAFWIVLGLLALIAFFIKRKYI